MPAYAPPLRRPRSALTVRGVVLLALVTLAPGCAASRPLSAPPPVATAAERGAQERLVVRRARLELASHAPDSVGARAERIVRAAGGEVESAVSDGARVRMSARVPAPALDATLDRLAALGRERRRQVSADDATAATHDLEARVRNLAAVRDRLRALLERASEVRDVIEVERELGRVQAELDVMQGRLDRLRTETATSLVSLEVERERVLGPLGWLLVGVASLVEKLFVLR